MWLEWGKRKVKNSRAWQFLGGLWSRVSVPTTEIILFNPVYALPVDWETTHEEDTEWEFTHTHLVTWETTHELTVELEV